jgi:hypothetical protein
MPAAEHDPDDAPEFRSPKRALARAFRLSRDRWKHKATRRLQQIKAFRVRVRDLEASRDLWKQKALHLQRHLEQATGPDPAPQGPGPADAPDPPGPTAPQGPKGPAPAEAPAAEGPVPKKARRARR